MSLLKRAAIIIASVEFIYLLVFNIALNIPFTQDLINKLRPEKFTVNWESAWTVYPFRIHARGITANGQTRRQQWQFETPQASASISLLPLVFKTVSLNSVNARNIKYFQRPRPRKDKDYAKLRPYFPPIAGRELELTPPNLKPLAAGKKGWKIEIQDMSASGEHSLWLYQIQASLKGDATADLSVLTRGGPVSVSNGEIDIALERITINGDHEVSRGGRINGSVQLLPFVIRENKGLKALAFLELDAELKVLTQSLDFLNIYLEAFEGMKLDGAGEIEGRLVFSQGNLLAQSKIDVSANALKLNLLDYRIEGEGEIHIEVPEAPGDTRKPETQFTIAFDALQAFYANESMPLLSGNDLVFSGVGTNNIIILNGEKPKARSLEVSLSSLEVPDLSAFQRFVPQKWPFKLHGGEGKLRGKVSVDHSSFFSSIKLSSEDANVGFNKFQFNSDLDMNLNLNSPSLQSGQVEVSGSYLKINETQVSNDQLQSKPWHAAINIEKGTVQLNLDKADPGNGGANKLKQALRAHEIGAMLGEADGAFKIKGSISDLGWLNVLMKNPFDLSISGGGEIISDVFIKRGWLDAGTELEVLPEEITVEVLDYVASGKGGLNLEITKGGEFPDITTDLNITKAQFQRKLEERAFVEDIDIFLRAKARNVKPGVENQDVSLFLNIPSAKITDMSIYNQYLPENSPVLITGGEADLVVDVSLETDSAAGYVNLTASDLRAHVDEQDISAELGVNIQLVGGKPKNMEFDITGSTIQLDAVNVVGESATFRDEDWAAKILFGKASTVWKKPIELDVKAEIEMTDSIPIVSMMANHKGKETWLTKALTIDDVKGDIHLKIAKQQIVIPYAFAVSDNIDVGAKAIISSERRNGMIYVRYKALKGLLKINDGKRNIDVLKAKAKFDAYLTDEVIAEKGLSE